MLLYKQHFLLIAAAGLAAAQTFDVASVKSAHSESGLFHMEGGPGSSDPGRINYTNIPLRRVLLTAYDVRNYQLLGPDWLNTLRFDITAKVPEGTSNEQFQAMLRNLLVSRFQMAVRRETKELPIFAVLISKTGVKLKPDAGSATPAEEQLATVKSENGPDGFPTVSLRSPGLIIETRNGRARVTARETPLVKLADFLSGQLGRPVFDMTGLTASYSFNLYFTPEGANSSDSPEPPIFAALQEQLGLRLEARKGPVELIVIDRAGKVPTEN